MGYRSCIREEIRTRGVALEKKEGLVRLHWREVKRE